MELQLASGFLPLLLLTWLPAGTANQTAESVITTQCKVTIPMENLTVHVEPYKPEGLEVWNQTNTVALEKNCTNLIGPCTSAAHVGIFEFRVFITRKNSTDTGNNTQERVLRCCLVGLQTSVMEEKIWTGFNFLCIIFGLVVGTIIYTPILGFLLWQCRRNRTDPPRAFKPFTTPPAPWPSSEPDNLDSLILHHNKRRLTRSELAEGNQLSMAASVTGTEDLTYANLRFEEKGTKPASSNIIYTEIKPLQQKQCGGDASAASTELYVSPKEEGK